jgi:hypothetical protein
VAEQPVVAAILWLLPPHTAVAKPVVVPVYGSTTSVDASTAGFAFSWEPVDGADYYEVQVSADPAFSTLLPSGKALEPMLLHTLLKSLKIGIIGVCCIARPAT